MNGPNLNLLRRKNVSVQIRIKYKQFMYQLRRKNCRKKDLEKRWALPDRLFFACGTCHILAYAFLKCYNLPDVKVFWIKPHGAHTGNHIFITWETSGSEWVFDYHGVSNRDIYLAHYWKRARQQFPGWDASLVELFPDALIDGWGSTKYDGLWLRAPHQYFDNPLPRADKFLARLSYRKYL